MTPQVQQQTATAAALIGMSCRLPGATTPAQLWQLLLDPAQAHQPGLAHGPITPELLRQVVVEAVSDACLSTRSLARSRTGVYVCTHPGSYADPELAESLRDSLSLTGKVAALCDVTAAALLHQAHHDLSVQAVDRAIVVALEEHEDLTRAVALVLATSALVEHHRPYAHITGTATAQPNAFLPVMRHALEHAGCGSEQVWFWHFPTTNPALPSPALPPSHQREHRPPLCVLPEPLSAADNVRTLVSVAATALALHYRLPPVRFDAAQDAAPSLFAPMRAQVAGCIDTSASQLFATVLTSTSRSLPVHHHPMRLSQMCPVSAPSLTALAQAARLRAETAPTASHVATLADTALERTHHRVRAAVISDNLGTAVQAFRSLEDETPNTDVVGPWVAPAVPPQLVYVMTGLAGVHPNAGAKLTRLGEYAEAVEEAREALAEHTTEPVWGPGERLTTVQHRRQATFIIQLALAAAWRARGLLPDTVVGCGAGEPAAAVVAGALSVRDAARVVVAHSDALAQMNTTGVLLVRASWNAIVSVLAPVHARVSMTLHLHAQAWCLAGPEEDLSRLQQAFQDRGHPVRRWHGDGAHTPAATRLVPDLRRALHGVRPEPAKHAHLVTSTPRSPKHSTLLDASYWASQIAETAYLSAALDLATEDARPSLLVEVAARTTISLDILHSVETRHDVTALSCEPTQFAHALGELYIRGHTPWPAHGRANADVVPPPTEEEVPPLPVPALEHTQDHLLALVSRIAHTDGPVPATCTWAELKLSEYDLVRLICDLRQVPAWRDLVTADLNSHQPLTVWAKDLAARLEAA